MISSDIRRRLLGSQNRLVSLGSQCQRWSLLGLNVNSRLAPLLVDTFFAHQGRFAISGSTPGPSTLASSPSLRFVSSSAFVISAWISSGLLTSHSIILPASHPLPPLTQGRFSGPTPESSTLASCLTLHLILNSAFVIAFWLGFSLELLTNLFFWRNLCSIPALWHDGHVAGPVPGTFCLFAVLEFFFSLPFVTVSHQPGAWIGSDWWKGLR